MKPLLGDYQGYGHTTCSAAIGPDINRDLCGQPATAHHCIGVDTLASCDEHAPLARRLFDVIDEHPWGQMCDMPSTVWVFSSPDEPGMCLWELEDEDLVAAANAQPVEATA